MQEINVITKYNLDFPYRYLNNKLLHLIPGDIVKVEVRNKITYGLVVNFPTNSYNKPLKQILAKIENIQLSHNLVQFIQWCANYNMISLGSILKMTLPKLEVIVKDFEENKKAQYTYTYHISKDISLNIDQFSPQKQEILCLLKNYGLLTTNLIKQHKIQSRYLNSLIKEGVINQQAEKILEESKHKHINTQLPIVLNSEQQQVSNKIKQIIQQNKFSVSLIDGVPGSGKTEVYFELIAQIIKENKTVLVLLPEIALSTQWLSRFKDVFNVDPYVWHSSISLKEKKVVLSHLITGKVKVIVGTRSALFLPLKNLGLIIIDEEHDSSFKQEDQVIYNARDMAITRASFEQIPIVLVTATPSLETWYNCNIGKYHYFQLTTRFNKSVMPSIQLVDINLSNIIKGEMLSEVLLNKLIINFNNKKQSLLFLNKRGYSNFNICKQCKSKVTCPKCSHGEENLVYLVSHKNKRKYICHKCNFSQKLSNDCVICNTKDSIVSIGTGIEKLEEELRAKIPSAKIVLASSDTINNVKKAEALLQDIQDNKLDIIIGTQILAKGYHFPNISLVGIVDAGLESNIIDLKSNERIWQVLYQVAGRAGREKVKGEVILQSYNNNYLIQTLINFQRNNFLDKELKDRLDNNLPPYTRLASIIVSSKNETKLLEVVNQLKRSIIKLPNIYHNYIKGPIPALFYKINQNYRYRFLVTSDKKFNLQKLISKWLSFNNVTTSVKIKIDIDPISFY